MWFVWAYLLEWIHDKHIITRQALTFSQNDFVCLLLLVVLQYSVCLPFFILPR